MREHPKQKGVLKKKRKLDPSKPMHLRDKLKSDGVDLPNMQNTASAASILFVPRGRSTTSLALTTDDRIVASSRSFPRTLHSSAESRLCTLADPTKIALLLIEHHLA